MSSPKEVFRLYANCKVTEGARRSLVCDLWHSRYDFIPNMLAFLLKEHADQSLEEIKAAYDPEHGEVIEEYYSFLVSKGYGFYTREPHLFPPLPEGYRYPGRISNAILDMDARSDYDIPSVLHQLDKLGCTSVQFRMYDAWRPEQWIEVLKAFHSTRIPDVLIITAYVQGLEPAAWERMVNSYPRISSLTLHSAPAHHEYQTPGQVSIQQTSQAVTDHSHCGVVHPAFFSINIEAYMEAVEANSCLNGKISIDREGYICKCPSLPERYGHVRDTSLLQALGQKDFARYDKITKDSVSVCKDCEFRYICSECRAFVQGPAYGTDQPGQYGKPAKCRYDPYTATYVSDDH